MEPYGVKMAKRSDSTAKASVLFIRLSSKDKRLLDKAAAEVRLGTSAWARQVLIKAVTPMGTAL